MLRDGLTASSSLEERLRALESDARAAYASGVKPRRGKFFSPHVTTCACVVGAAWVQSGDPMPDVDGWYDWAAERYGISKDDAANLAAGFDGDWLKSEGCRFDRDSPAFAVGERLGRELFPLRDEEAKPHAAG